jgi:hypothetical protein
LNILIDRGTLKFTIIDFETSVKGPAVHIKVPKTGLTPLESDVARLAGMLMMSFHTVSSAREH